MLGLLEVLGDVGAVGVWECWGEIEATFFGTSLIR